MKRATALVVIVAASSISLSAQWPKYPERDVGRDAQGRVLMEGPMPRTPDGKPDLTGVWTRADRDPPPRELAGTWSRRTTRGDTGTWHLTQ